jgi:CheY-like chemotaxis protein
MIILIADDHADTRELVKALLEMSGHIVIEAANGREAVDIATVSTPDLILMDCSMPIMDGLAATRILRAQPETSTIRILAVTAHGNDPSWRRMAVQSGCNACYAKPLDFTLLGKMLENTTG